MSQLLYHQTIIKDELAPWMVFIHGAGGSIKTWKYQEQFFQKHFNLLLLDLRDHGQSNHLPVIANYDFDMISEDIKRVLDHCGIEKAVFMSLSMGSIVLQNFAIKYPKRVSATIMCGGVFKVNWKIRLFTGSGLTLTKFIPYKWMYLIFSYLVMPRKNHQLARRIFIQQSRKLSQEAYDRWLGLYQYFHELTTFYFNTSFQHPQLVVMGSQDYVFLDAAKKFSNRHKQVQLSIIEGAGHICNIDAYRIFNENCLHFYESIASDKYHHSNL